jgi:uncharacterized protein YdaU (DUF1376 family)
MNNSFTVFHNSTEDGSKNPGAPNRFYPFFYRDVFDETECEPEFIFGGYMRAICRYWSECCQGLRNDTEYLQKICHLTDEQWAKVRDTIFGKFFYLDEETDLWKHPRIDQQWTKAEAAYARCIKGGLATQRKFAEERLTKSLPPPRKAIAKARA